MRQLAIDFIATSLLFLAWTLLVYAMHRIAHWKIKGNFLRALHLAHHKVDYSNEINRRLKWYNLFFYFGSLNATLDVIMMLTLPAVMIFLLYPRLGAYILVFHYLYEVFLSEGVLDHNPKINGFVTKYFSWGDYHLEHHKRWNCNYSLMVTVWDRVFRTYRTPSKSS